MNSYFLKKIFLHLAPTQTNVNFIIRALHPEKPDRKVRQPCLYFNFMYKTISFKTISSQMNTLHAKNSSKRGVDRLWLAASLSPYSLSQLAPTVSPFWAKQRLLTHHGKFLVCGGALLVEAMLCVRANSAPSGFKTWTHARFRVGGRVWRVSLRSVASTSRRTTNRERCARSHGQAVSDMSARCKKFLSPGK